MAARKRGLDPDRLSITGTGWQGGICEKDILAYEGAGAPLAAGAARVSPLAAKIAQAEGVSLAGLTGSGPGGKIMKADVLANMRKPSASAAAAAAKPAAKAPAASRAGEITPDGKEILDTLPYSGVRRIIAERLSDSWQAAPHVFFSVDVEMDEVVALRKRVNEAQEHKTSVTDFIVMAVVKSLGKYPDVNVMIDGEQILRFKSVNIGVAVAAENGLIVPVVKNAQNLSLVDISKESAKMVDKARTGKLVPPDYTGGTFTISNLGMFGIDHFTAIINPPEAAILAVSATQRRPVVKTDKSGKEEMVVRSVMKLALSADHRVIDGLLAAQFIGEIRKQLENPLGLLL